MKKIDFILNGKQTILDVEDNETLLQALRERLDIKSVKEGCSIGECGACTVLIDNEPHYSCLTLASKASGHDIKTVSILAMPIFFIPSGGICNIWRCSVWLLYSGNVARRL